MPDPGSRVRTYEVGSTPTGGEINAVQDNYVANHERMHTRAPTYPVYTNFLQTGGDTVSITASGVISTVDGTVPVAEFMVPILPLWIEPASKIISITARVNQAAVDKWTMSLNEVDDVNSTTTVGSIVDNATTGWKDLTLAGLDRPILAGYHWNIRFVHGNESAGGNELLELKSVSIQLGG